MKDQQQVRTKILNRYSLRTKLTLGVILIFAFFGYFCIYWFGEFYKKDKIAYLFDLQASNSLRLSELAKISLSNQGQQVGLKNSSRQLFEPSDQNSLRNLKLEGLKRLPGENEFFAFFGEEKRQWQILFLGTAKTLVTQNIALQGFSKINSNDETSRQWLATDSGTVIWSSQAPGSLTKSKVGQNSRLPNYALKAIDIKLSQSASTYFNDQGERIIVAVKSVDGTNLLAVSEIPLNVVQEGLKKPLSEFTMFAGIILVTLIFSVSLLGRTVTSSLGVVESLLSKFAKGESVHNMPQVSPEFAKVWTAFRYMQDAVLSREYKLNRFASAIQSALSLAVSNHLFDSFSRSAAKIFSVLKEAFPKLEPHDMIWAMEVVIEGKPQWYQSNPKSIAAGAQRIQNPLELLEQLRSQADLEVICLGPESHLMAILALRRSTVTNEQEASLLKVIVSTLDSLAERIVLARLEKESLKSGAELDIARNLQMSCLIEKSTGTAPVCIAHSAHYEPCDKMGGDWIGIVNHTDLGFVDFFVGDVTGHGLGSAFVTSLVSGIIQSEEQSLFERGSKCDQGKHLKVIAERLNHLIFDTASSERWMTMLLGCIDYRNGYFYCVNAGHISPFVLSQSGEVRALATVQGNPLGSQSLEEFQIQKYDIRKTDTIVFPTDGLIESFVKKDGSKLNTKYLRKVLSNVAKRSDFQSGKLSKSLSSEIVQEMALGAVRGPSESVDDITVMSVTWRDVG